MYRASPPRICPAPALPARSGREVALAPQSECRQKGRYRRRETAQGTLLRRPKAEDHRPELNEEGRDGFTHRDERRTDRGEGLTDSQRCEDLGQEDDDHPGAPDCITRSPTAPASRSYSSPGSFTTSFVCTSSSSHW